MTDVLKQPIWGDIFLMRLQHQTIEDQSEICCAIETFARSGRGDVSFHGGEDRPIVNIRTKSFVVMARVDSFAETIFALDFFRR